MKKRSAVAVAFLTGVGALALPAAPAHASTQCTTTTTVTGYDWDGYLGTITLPSAPGGIFNCYLAQGDVSSAVRPLQTALVYCKHENAPVISIDGNFGPKTKAAVVYEQKADSITADGVYGPETRTHMAWYNNLGHCSYSP